MPEEYEALVTAMKALAQDGTTLPVAENDWTTRPDTESYGTIMLDFETDALRGDNVKKATAYEGSMDLYSHDKDGAGWIQLIRAALTEHCEGAWSLNHHTYERETGLFHWEWVFQVEE